MLSGKRRHDFEVSFKKSVNALLKERGNTQEYRKEQVDLLIEGYVANTGDYPSSKLLEKLADVLLLDDLVNTDPYKMRNEEYSILSDDQLHRRVYGDRVRKALKTYEVPFEGAEDEINRTHNTMLNEYYVYSPPIEKTIARKKSNRRKNNRHDYPVTVSYIEPSPIVKPVLPPKNGRGEDGRAWSLEVKARDGYQCQNPKCNSRVGIMHAHHIESYVDNPDLRLDTGNGITLCESCHNDFHSIYGKGGNSGEQIREFFA